MKEGWWLVNKKVTNNFYSPSPRNFSFFFMFKTRRLCSSGGVVGKAVGPILGSNPRIVPKIKYQSCPQLITNKCQIIP